MTFSDKIKNLVLSYKGLSTLGISNVLSSIIAVVFWFLVAFIVETEDYGRISFFISIALIVSAFATPGISNTLMVYGSKDIKIRAPLFLFAIILVTIASIIVFFIINDFATSLFLFGYATFSLTISELLGRKLFGQILKISVIQKILSIATSVSLYYVIGLDGIILGLALSYLIYIPKFVVILKQFSFNFSVLKKYKGFMQDNFGFDLSRILTTQVDKLIIFPLFGFLTLGNYFLAIQVLAIGIIIPGTVYQYLLPQESKVKSFKNLKIATIIFAGIIAILTIVLAPVLLPILFPNFVDVVEMIQIMILAIFPQTINLMYITKFLTKGKSRVVLIGSALFIIVQISTIVVLGNMIGIYGIALALLFGHVVEFFYLMIYARHYDD